MYNTIQIKRRLPDSVSGPGAPASLSGGELAYNEIDNTLYYGASATADHGSVIAIAGPGMFVDRTTTQRISGEKTFFDIATFENQVNIEKSLSVTENVSANNYFINSGIVIDSNRNATLNNIQADGNLTVTGNLSVLGDFTQIDTQVTTTSAFAITNTGSGPALTVTQTGENAIAAFYDDSDIAFYVAGTTGNAGFVGIGTATPNEKLTVTGNISATGTIYADGGLSVDGGGANTTLFVQNGEVGINTETPNEALTVVGNISASQNIYAVNGDFTGSIDADGATTLGSTLYVTSAATFASSVSAAGTLTVDGLATFNADVTVVDKLQVQSTDFNPGVTGTHVEVEGTNVKVAQCGPTEVTTTYGLDGITTVAANATYIIATDNSQGIEINSNSGANDIDLTATNVNITAGDLEIQSGNLNGNGTNSINDFIIDGGSF